MGILFKLKKNQKIIIYDKDETALVYVMIYDFEFFSHIIYKKSKKIEKLIILY